MAKKAEGAVAEKNTEAKTEEAAETKESRYHEILVRVFKDITSDDFDPESALNALAENASLTVKSKQGKNGRVTFQVDTAESAKVSGRGRPKKLVSKETEKNAIKLLRAAMKDPDKAAAITALLAASENGTDVTDELQKVIGIE